MTPALPRILICGNSLLLAGLEASLRNAPGVQVLHASDVPGTCEVPGTWGRNAAVAVYDQAETDLGQLAAWLTGAPGVQTLKVSETFRVLDGLTLLGLDAEHDRVHVVTGHSRAVAAVGELTRVVLEAVGAGSG
ncbi:MAG: hypothetical protein FJ011_19715 [Chloroflexi bacterium]|nr:hypothetical protein [Chloroflexota bacterium]